MTPQRHHILKRSAILIAVVLPFLLPAQGLAETLVFVNDTNQKIVVQVAAVVRGKVVRGAPCTLKAGEKVPINVLGNKLVNVYDAKLPNRLLFTGTIPASPADAAYSIKQTDARLPKVDIEMIKPAVIKRY